MSDPYSQADIVCRTCRRPLDQRLTVEGITWQHGAAAPDDHPAEPVDREATGGEMVSVCDFCSAPHPMWVHPCQDFTLESVPGLHDGYTAVGAWAACEDCHRLVTWGDWSALADRSTRRYPPQVRKTMRDLTRKIHAGYRANAVGEPYRVP